MKFIGMCYSRPGRNLKEFQMERGVKDIEEYVEKLAETEEEYNYRDIQGTIIYLDKELTRVKGFLRHIKGFYWSARIYSNKEKIQKKEAQVKSLHTKYLETWKPEIERLLAQKDWVKVTAVLTELPDFDLNLRIEDKSYAAMHDMDETLEILRKWKEAVRKAIPPVRPWRTHKLKFMRTRIMKSMKN